ncbi:MAG: fumarylacetoacetate hydrolase family protein [Gemmataceae bacterium]
MRLARVRTTAGDVGVVRIDDRDQAYPVPGLTLAELLDSPDPATLALDRSGSAAGIPLSSAQLLPPIDRQEVWAAGVTYKRSKVAREEESAGAARFYDKVYSADRPELFLKSTPERVVGPGGTIRVRRDAKWSVPEPELALVISPDLRVVGYTVGNDVSSRDIEGENPLYLPQAKIYDGACAVGPVVTLAAAMPPLPTVGIRLVIRRNGQVAFDGRTDVGQMARTPDSLVEWLGREYSFPHGAVLLTGTGIVPPDEFSLAPGDVVDISIDGIGTLTNPVSG